MLNRWRTVVSVCLLSCSVASGMVPGAPSLFASRDALAAESDGAYTPLSPARLVDTRAGQHTVDGQWAGGGVLGPGTTIDLTILGRGGVPASGADAVVLNVTVTNPTASSFLAVYPAGQPRPTASNLNFVANQTVPNLVIAKVGTGGKVTVFNWAGATDLVVDVMGWFPTGGSYTGLTPARLADSRPGQSTVDGQLAGGGKISVGATLEVPVLGRGSVPANGVGAVVVNVTVTEPTASSFLTVYPAGQPRPTASNLNFVANQSVPNLVVAKVGTGGKITLYNFAGSAHVLVDVMGWLPTSGDYTAMSPARLADTRSGGHTIDGQLGGSGAVGYGDHLVLPVLGRGGVPVTGVGAVVLNVTVTRPSTGGFVTVYPGWENRPNASNLNFVANQTVPNLVIAKVGAGGKIDLGNAFGSTDLVVDVMGWFPGTNVADATAVSLSSFSDHSCAVMSNGRVQCWGDNTVGQIGNGERTDGLLSNVPRGVSAPQTVLGIENAIAVDAGYSHSCAALADGHVACWGTNVSTESGGPSSIQVALTPIVVPSVAGATAVAVGGGFSCALVSGGQVKCWGSGYTGQMGRGDSALVPQAPPDFVSGVTGAVSLDAGFGHACVILANGTAKCWGQNGYRQIGIGYEGGYLSVPQTVTTFTGMSSVGLGWQHACATQAGGTVSCWGNNDSYQLGGYAPNLVLGPIPNLVDVVKVGGPEDTCALDSGGTVICWGDGDAELFEVTGFTAARDVSSGASMFCEVTIAGKVKCAGYNDLGQLGNGTLVDSGVAVDTLLRA